MRIDIGLDERQHHADDLTSLQDLARRVNALPKKCQVLFAAYVLDNGLMKPRGLGMKWIHFVVKLRSRIKRESTAVVWHMLLSRDNMAPLLQDTVEATLDWMIAGKDTYDSDSVGGFCQNEVDQLSVLTQTLEYRRPTWETR